MLWYYLHIFHETCIHGSNFSRGKIRLRISSAAARNAQLAFFKRFFAVSSIFHQFTLATGTRSYTYIRYINCFQCLGRTSMCHWQIGFWHNSFLSTLASVETNFIPSNLFLKLSVCYLPDSGRQVTSFCQGLFFVRGRLWEWGCPFGSLAT